MSIDDIAAVEAAYAIDLPAQAWLGGLLDAATRLRELGENVIAFEYDARGAIPTWPLAIEVRGMDVIAAPLLRGLFTHSDVNVLRSLYEIAGPVSAMPPVTLFSETFGSLLASAPFKSLPQSSGSAELVLFNATDGSGRGVFISVRQKVARAVGARTRHHLARLGAHVATATRLRHAIDKNPHVVLSSDGRDVLHAEPGAQGTLERLRAAARRIDRARGALRRRDGDEALDAWTALVDGRWSLIDRFESDGKRFMVAVENPPGVGDPRQLTPMERSVTQLAAHGHSNKLAAYQLGITVGSVGAYLSAAMRKLNIRSRVALVVQVQAMNKASIARLAFGDDEIMVASGTPPAVDARLTRGERAVVVGVLDGLSNVEIAQRRDVSERTIASQLAGVYRKLGVGSRGELAARRR